MHKQMDQVDLGSKLKLNFEAWAIAKWHKRLLDKHWVVSLIPVTKNNTTKLDFNMNVL